jgi:hypothetical protein
LDSLKGYFDVTNTYVLHKLRIIAFPFSLKVSEYASKFLGGRRMEATGFRHRIGIGV